MLNSPHNPTGAVLHKEDIEALRSIVYDTNIFILSDEVYEHLIFDGIAHQSILRYPDLLQRSFVCFSFGKVYHCTGWKLGYSISSDYLMNEFRKIHQFNAFSCDTPKQVALATFLKKKETKLRSRRSGYFKMLSCSCPSMMRCSYTSSETTMICVSFTTSRNC